jgi:hypothetical protein
MKRHIRRRVRALQAYAGGATLALVALVSGGFAQSGATQRIDELTVQRLKPSTRMGRCAWCCPTKIACTRA